jgi:hypothetical protein
VLHGHIPPAGIFEVFIDFAVTVVVSVVALFGRWRRSNALPSGLTAARPSSLASAFNARGFVVAFFLWHSRIIVRHAVTIVIDAVTDFGRWFKSCAPNPTQVLVACFKTLAHSNGVSVHARTLFAMV